MIAEMLDTPVLEEVEEAEEVSVFAQRLRASAEERSEVLDRERRWLHEQLDGLRTKATAEERRGWSVRRVISI